MLLWAALKVTVHATIQLKRVFSFLSVFFFWGGGSRACLVWFGFLSGFPRKNPLPGEKEGLCEAPPAALLPHPHGSGDRSQCTFSRAESWISPGCFQLVCITSIHRSFLFYYYTSKTALICRKSCKKSP